MNRWVGSAASARDRRVGIIAAGDEAECILSIGRDAGGDPVATNAAELAAGIGSGTLAAAVVTAEGLAGANMSALAEALDRQPPWSDFPFVLIVDRAAVPAELELMDQLRNVTLVERPVEDLVLRKAVKAALRSRDRQHEAEAFLLQRESVEEHLRQLTGTLESRIRERMADLRAANKRLVLEMEERKDAEARLRESEELYRFTIELSRQMAWTADPEGHMVTVSPRFYEVTGADPSLPPHEAWLQVVHPQDLAQLSPHWERALATGEDHIVHFRMKVVDGSYRTFCARAAPRRDASGRIIRWYGSTEDITEQRQMEAASQAAEEKLRESEELYRYTVELSQGIVWTSGAEGNFEGMSARYWELTGMEPGTLPRHAIHPDDRERVLKEWAEATASGKPHHTEYRLRLRDGSYRHMRARAAARRDEQGNVIRWYGMLEDIEQQKQAELALQEAEERYRLATKATNNAIWDLDLVKEEIIWAGSSIGLFGYPQTQVTSLGWWEERVHPDDRDAVIQSLDKAIRSRRNHWGSSYRFRTAAGEWAEVYDQGYIIRDASGTALRAVGAIADLTELRRSEAETRRIQSELIHVSRLSAMGAMASALAHELNQPLTAISSYLRGSRRLLEQKGASNLPQVLGAIEAAEEGALRAGQMVRRLRELVSRGNVTVRAEELSKLVQDAAFIGFVDEGLMGVSHRIEHDPAAKWVEVDRIQIQQVLINLIRNAIQAMEDQPRREVVISTRAVSPTTAEVCVADTGCGIPEGVREALFSPFQSSKAEGMGIGLSISRTIIEAHGGKIWAEDREGGGTIFRFTLRIAEDPGNEAGEAAA